LDQTKGVGPHADAGEEVALGVSSKVVRSDIGDASLVNVAGGDVPRGNQVAQPLGCVGVDLVVIGGHRRFPRISTWGFSSVLNLCRFAHS